MVRIESGGDVGAGQDGAKRCGTKAKKKRDGRELVNGENRKEEGW